MHKQATHADGVGRVHDALGGVLKHRAAKTHVLV